MLSLECEKGRKNGLMMPAVSLGLMYGSKETEVKKRKKGKRTEKRERNVT